MLMVRVISLVRVNWWITMGDVLEFKRHWVWFFKEPVTCDYCLQETRGKVWERMQSLVGRNCNEAWLLIDEKTSDVLTVDFDDEDHDDVS